MQQKDVSVIRGQKCRQQSLALHLTYVGEASVTMTSCVQLLLACRDTCLLEHPMPVMLAAIERAQVDAALKASDPQQQRQQRSLDVTAPGAPCLAHMLLRAGLCLSCVNIDRQSLGAHRQGFLTAQLGAAAASGQQRVLSC